MRKDLFSGTSLSVFLNKRRSKQPNVKQLSFEGTCKKAVLRRPVAGSGLLKQQPNLLGTLLYDGIEYSRITGQ